MILGYIENLINIVPVSGVKIGLSNVVLLYCIYKFTFAESLHASGYKGNKENQPRC